MPKVWVIIVGYRNPDDIETCVRAISTQSFSEWGLVICENGGRAAFEHLTDTLCKDARNQSAEAVDRYNDYPRRVEATHRAEIFGDHPLYLLQADGNLGYAGAVNAAIAEIQADRTWEHIWILNPDTEPHISALAYLLQKAENPEYGIVGGCLVYKETNLVQAYGGVWSRLAARGVSLGRDDPPNIIVDTDDIERRIDYVLGACMLVTRDYIEAIGTMNDDYFLYCEEVDWCLRRQTFRLGYAHQAVVYHTQGTTIGSKGAPGERSRLSVYLGERNGLLIARRFFKKRFLLIALIAGLRIGRYAKNAAWQNFLAALHGWWAGMRNESGAPPDRRFRH